MLKIVKGRGTSSGLPDYVTAVSFLLIFILLIPEFLWTSLGVNVLTLVVSLPEIFKYYVSNSNYPNTSVIFWLLAPVVLGINTTLFMKHFNGKGYSAYLARRKERLIVLGKVSDTTLLINTAIIIIVFLWMILGHLEAPAILGNFAPLKNRLAMLILYGLPIALVLPASITLLVVEIRAALVKSN